MKNGKQNEKKKKKERLTVGGVASSSKNGATFQKVFVADGQITNTRNKRQAPTFD